MEISSESLCTDFSRQKNSSRGVIFIFQNQWTFASPQNFPSLGRSRVWCVACRTSGCTSLQPQCLPLTRMHPTLALMQPLQVAKTIFSSLLSIECFPGEKFVQLFPMSILGHAQKLSKTVYERPWTYFLSPDVEIAS